VLILELVLHVASCESFVALVVVFDVIGAQVLAGIADIDIIVRDEEIALAALRTLCRKFSNATLGCGWTDLLQLGSCGPAENQSKR
jgi:hypothetical protein